MFLAEPPRSDGQRALYDADRSAGGYVDNLTRAWAWRPDVERALSAARAALLDGSALDRADVAVLNAATAAARRDSYCALAWGRRLASHVGADAAAAVVAGDMPAGLDRRAAALVRWARAVATDPAATTADDVEALREVGLTDREVFEATVLVAQRMAFSTVNAALGAVPDAQLAASTPAPVRAAVDYGRPPATEPSA